MINVFYWPRDQRLVMTGHAENKGSYHSDVCAAASALFYALCTTSNGFLKYKWLKARYHLDEKGLAYCKMWPKKRYFKRTRVAIGMCVGGLMMLADQHPHLVRVDVVTGTEFDDVTLMQEASQGGVTYLRKFCYDMLKDRPLNGQKGKQK